MKITNIQPIRNYTYNKKNTNNHLTKTNYKPINLNYYPVFLGGYSLDLSMVNKNLKKEEFPPDIFELVQLILKNNPNPQNKTLYDIHFEKYKNILECYSLEELKETYPEFKDVISVFDVEAEKNSFIGEFLEEKSDIFSTEEDLTLQLIKLYWGQGFSLNDLTKYISENSKDKKNINLYYTMVKKLNIPLMNSHYASVLKLSNKEYNKNLIERISIKRKESIEAKKQKQEGEPVVIPKGPLSKAHVKHISEELEDHFRNNPEKIYNQTKRQNHFLNENPELREKMSEAMIYAWNRTKEGLSVKKYLSKFMKKYGGISEEELALKVTVPKEKITALELFWIKNPWARENFSIAVNKGWDYTKNYSPKIYFEAKNDENHITLNLIPTMVNHKISSWAKENNFFIDENAHYGRILINKGKDYSNDEKAKQYSKKIEKTTVEYYKKHPEDADICATVLQLTLIDFENDLEKIDKTLPDFIRNNPELLENFKQLLSSLFHKTQIYKKSGEFNKNPIENIEFKTLIGIFTNIAEILAITPEGCKVAEYLNNKLDKIYNLFLTNNRTKINKIVTG